MVAGQLPIARFDAFVLFDFGPTYSFILLELTTKFDDSIEKTRKVFRMALPSGNVLLVEYCFKRIPIISCGHELKIDFIVLEMKDFDVILGMNFLGENNAIINW